MNKLLKKVPLVVLLIGFVLGVQVQASQQRRTTKGKGAFVPRKGRWAQKSVQTAVKASATVTKNKSTFDLLVVALEEILAIVSGERKSKTTISDLGNAKKDVNEHMRALNADVRDRVKTYVARITKLNTNSSEDMIDDAQNALNEIRDPKMQVDVSTNVTRKYAEATQIMASPTASQEEKGEALQAIQAEEETGFMSRVKRGAVDLKNWMFGEEVSNARAAFYTVAGAASVAGASYLGYKAAPIAYKAYSEEGFSAVPGALYEAGKTGTLETYETAKQLSGKFKTTYDEGSKKVRNRWTDLTKWWQGDRKEEVVKAAQTAADAANVAANAQQEVANTTGNPEDQQLANDLQELAKNAANVTEEVNQQ